MSLKYLFFKNKEINDKKEYIKRVKIRQQIELDELQYKHKITLAELKFKHQIELKRLTNMHEIEVLEITLNNDTILEKTKIFEGGEELSITNHKTLNAV